MNAISKCRACPDTVLWARHKTTKKANPLDSEPDGNGNILLDPETLLYEVLTGEDLDRAREMPSVTLYISHFATCPARRKT